MMDGDSAFIGFILGVVIGGAASFGITNESWRTWERKEAVRHGEAYYDKTTGAFTRVEK